MLYMYIKQQLVALDGMITSNQQWL